MLWVDAIVPERPFYVGLDRDPGPAFLTDIKRGARELIGGEPFEQMTIGQEALVRRAEEIADDGPAESFVDREADEAGQPVRDRDRGPGEYPPDRIRFLVPVRQLGPGGLVVDEREGHHLIERELALAEAGTESR